MGIAMYTGVSGMMAFQELLNVTSHNIANVNTAGYKVQHLSFSDLLYTRMNIHRNYVGQGAAEGEEGGAPNPEMVGHGVKPAAVNLIYGQAGADTTNYPLDFMIMGDGFFAVDSEGSIEYTRNGAFSLEISGSSSAYLIAPDGARILDQRKQPIRVSIVNGEADTEGLEERLGVFQFANPYGLIPAEGSRFLESSVSGEAKDAVNIELSAQGYKVVQGALEFSSVDLGTEMVKVIEAQRAFQLNSKVVQTADQLDETINNLR